MLPSGLIMDKNGVDSIFNEMLDFEVNTELNDI
jgi:hypothetical protein